MVCVMKYCGECLNQELLSLFTRVGVECPSHLDQRVHTLIGVQVINLALFFCFFFCPWGDP